MSKRYLCVFVAAVVWALGVGSAAPILASDETPPSEVMTAMEESLRAVETAFAASAAVRDQALFRTFLADDVVFAGGDSPFRGPDAVLAGWAAFFAAVGPSIEWRPESAVVTDDGLLGMTRGPYVIRSTAPDGSARESTGTFFSVWRRISVEDPWRILLDGGAPSPPCICP